MHSNKKFLTAIYLILSLVLISAGARGQNCKDAFNNALNYYNKGQYENIYNYLTGCIDNINNTNANYYRNNNEGNVIVFKVYKIIINSYRYLDRENFATKKMNELVLFFVNRFSREVVEEKLRNTPLTPIE
jgi:hypothetical protein